MPCCHAAIGCIAERSSFNAGLILARTLRDRGHRVSFVGAPRAEFRRHVERHGYPFVPLGSAALAVLTAAAAKETGRLAAARAWHRVHARLRADLDEVARELRPDVAFLDVLAWDPAAYLLSTTRTPTFIFHGGMLSARFSSRYPPIWSSMVPPRPAEATRGAWRLRCTAAWARARYARRRRLMAARRPWVPALLDRYASWRVRLHAARRGWRFCWGDWGPQPALPEVVMNHRAFDWPSLRSPDRCYLSGGQATRTEFEGDWAAPFDGERPLIYAVTSTMIGYGDVFEPGPGLVVRKSAAKMKRFLDAVAGAVAQRPEWQLLLACGPFARTFAAGSLPPNVRVLERAPQTAVLQRAAVMITQAGAGAVREAVAFGVPMLLFPLWTDQFGNSARAVYHGVGERLDYEGATAAKIAAAIERMLAPGVRQAAGRLSDECARDATNEVERFAAFVEAHAGIEI